MDSHLLAWLVIVFGFLLPLGHVIISPKAGSWRPPPGSGCPIGPRLGWIVLVLLMGIFGWLLFITRRSKRINP